MRALEEEVLFPLVESGDAHHVLARVPGSLGGGETMNSGFVILAAFVVGEIR